MKRHIHYTLIAGLGLGGLLTPVSAQEKKNDPAYASRMAESDREASSVSFQGLREEAVRRLDSARMLSLLAARLYDAGDVEMQAALLRGMLAGLEGRRNVAPPDEWGRLRARVEEGGNPTVLELFSRVSRIFGDQTAIRSAVAALKDGSKATELRRSALRSLVALQHDELGSILRGLVDEGPLQVDAIRAFGSIQDEDAPGLLLKRYPDFGFQAQRATLETLSTRRDYAIALMGALKEEVVPKTELPVYLARSLDSMLGSGFREVFGELDELTADKAVLMAKYKALLTPERLQKADGEKGKVLFQGVCAACHQMDGEGGKIGPDLTGSNRANLDYILLNMIDPSGDVPDAYKMVTVSTRDGQVLAGTIAQEDDQRIVMNLIGQQQTILKSDIVERERSAMSMMPEGLLPALPDAQVLELVKYLQTSTEGTR